NQFHDIFFIVQVTQETITNAFYGFDVRSVGGCNVQESMIAASLYGLNLIGIGGVTLQGNMISMSGGTGIALANITGAATVGGAALSEANSIAGAGHTGTGIAIGQNSSATIRNDFGSIHGFDIGIDVNGSSAAATISPNHNNDNTTGIRFTNSGSGSVN